jgi:hypothetical protein
VRNIREETTETATVIPTVPVTTPPTADDETTIMTPVMTADSIGVMTEERTVETIGLIGAKSGIGGVLDQEIAEE